MEHRKEVKADEVQKKLKEDRVKVQDSKEAVKTLKAVLEKAEANLSDQKSRTDEAPPNEAPPELQANPPVGGKGTAAAERPEAEAAEEVDNAADKQDAKEGARSGPPLSPELEEKSLANARKMDREDIQPDNAREAEAPVLGESPEVEAAEEVDRAADKLAKATTKEEKAEAEDELKMAQEKQDAKAGPDSRAPLSPAELEEKSLTNARKMDQEGTMSSPAAAATDEPADDTGMPLDKTTKRMLAAYVQQKRSLCQISFQEKSPHQPKQMEKSVKLQLNCAKEANVKGAIKRRELRVAMAKKVTALSACATTAYAKAEKRVSLLEVKLVNSNVDLAGWKAKKQEKDAELAECNNELQVAKTARAEARATLSSIHDRMQMLKAQAGSDGDKMIAGLKKARADEASKKAQIKESLAKLKSEGGSSIEAKRKAIKMMKQLAAEENKVAADMKMAAKDHAKVLKSRFVAEQLKELGDGVFANQTAATKRLETVKSDQKKIADTEKVEAEQAKKDQQKLKNEKAKLKDEEAQTKKLKLEANQEKKKVQGAEKKVKDEDAKEKKAEGAESKVRQQAAVIRQLRLTVAANSKVMLLAGCHRV